MRITGFDDEENNGTDFADSINDTDIISVPLHCKCPKCGGEMVYIGFSNVWECVNRDTWGNQCNREVCIQNGPYPHFEERNNSRVIIDRLNPNLIAQ